MMKFIAHRGFSKKFPENTLEAFRAVITHPHNRKKLIGFECDIQLTSDNKIPVIHDTSIADESMQAVEICEITFSKLQKMYRFQKDDVRLSVPDINQVLDLVNHRTNICIEIKKAAYDLVRLADLLIDSLSAYSPEKDVTISSFSYEILEYIIPQTKKLGVNYSFIFDNWDSWNQLPESIRTRLDYIHPKAELVLENSERVREIQIPAQCWTINDLEMVQAMANLTDDSFLHAIMTDDISIVDRFKEP